MRSTLTRRRRPIRQLIASTGAFAAVVLFSSPVISQEQTMPREAKVTFAADTAIELAYLSIKDGKQKQFHEDYFPKVMPIGTEHGGKPIGGFRVRSMLTGQTKPQMIGLFQWPNVDGYIGMSTDPRYPPLKAIRDDALAYCNNANFYTVAQDTEVTFREDRVYELWAGWMKPTGNKMVPTASTQDQQIVLTLQAVPRTSPVESDVNAVCRGGAGHDGHSADMVVIREWPSAKAFEDFVKTDAFKTTQRVREQATSSHELFDVAFSFPPKADAGS